MSSPGSCETRGKPTKRVNIPKDNWLGFIGERYNKFSGEVRFKSMLRIDGHFSGSVSSPDGTLVVTDGAQITQAAHPGGGREDKWNGGGRNPRHQGIGTRPYCRASREKSVAPALTVEEGAQLNAHMPPGLDLSFDYLIFGIFNDTACCLRVV